MIRPSSAFFNKVPLHTQYNNNKRGVLVQFFIRKYRSLARNRTDSEEGDVSTQSFVDAA